MNFNQAKSKLKKIADGKYHCVRYEIIEYNDGSIKQECNVYIENLGWFESTSWEGAFELLENPKSVEIEPIEELDAKPSEIIFEPEVQNPLIQDTSNQW